MQKYLRIISALLPQNKRKQFNQRYVAIYLRRFLFLFLVIIVGVLLQLLVFLNDKYIEARKLFDEKQKEYIYWTNVASQFPQIPDILYNASLSSISVGKKDEAMRFVDKALLIDPLFQKAKTLKVQMMKM